MRRNHSIRRRLTLAAALMISVALILAGLALATMFSHQLRRMAENELADRAITLMSGLDPNAPLREPAGTIGGDPRYLQPYSGFYWRIRVADRTYRSESLWDATLPLAAAPPRGESRVTTGPGPDGQELIILDQTLLLGPDEVETRVSVAVNRATQVEAQGLFARSLVPFLIVLGLVLVGASVLQVAVGLRPFRQIGSRIDDLNAGRLPRLGQDMPDEVRPLAEAVNRLLDDREARIEKARNRSSDLAHTLKTPLQALFGETGRLRDAGQGKAADAIEEIVEMIQSRIDHELGRERISGKGISNPVVVVRKVAAVLRRTARGSEITIGQEVAPQDIRVDPHDLTEIIGSLAENAMRHARSRVHIWTEADTATLSVCIRDDGAGIPEGQLNTVTRRGVRLLQDPEGTGLGLALAQEIVDANGGTLALENRDDGFCVKVTFAKADDIPLKSAVHRHRP
ncbi:sensor histidine kinase [Paracoccus onubensis]|uniref:histidine kinase n=1 Tax=Paracoccus onubensis TaxID=1675788 RepID=A0A418T8B4_9RHOB|nr:HAMP domain-containing sensor histidine kinase [Paracoccus onubensis]RJE89459.1 sensor histidine kinase [Paracoccus onubensis]